MARPRLTHRPRDMVLSLAVILLPVIAVMAFFTRTTQTPVHPVAWEPVAAAASQEAGFPVVAPRNLPSGWTCTRASWEQATWTTGWLSPGQVYVQVIQRREAPDALIAQASRQGRPDGSQQVGSASWDRFASPDGRTRALVRRGGDVTTVVAGDLSYEDLASFVGTLG